MSSNPSRLASRKRLRQQAHAARKAHSQEYQQAAWELQQRRASGHADDTLESQALGARMERAVKAETDRKAKEANARD